MLYIPREKYYDVKHSEKILGNISRIEKNEEENSSFGNPFQRELPERSVLKAV